MIKWNEVTWYSRLGALILFLAVVPALCFYIGTQYELTVFDTVPTLTHVVTAPATTSPVLPSVFLGKFTFSDFFKGEAKGFPDISFISTSTGNTLTFGYPLNDVAHQNVNAGFQVYVNKTKIGEIGGEITSVIGFSPNGRHFAVQTSFNNGCAGTCQSFQLYIIDVVSKTIVAVKWPRKVTHVVSAYDADPTVFADTQHWDDTGNLLFTFYSVDHYKDGNFYRSSPKEVWSYNVATGDATLMQTLPE